MGRLTGSVRSRRATSRSVASSFYTRTLRRVSAQGSTPRAAPRRRSGTVLAERFLVGGSNSSRGSNSSNTVIRGFVGANGSEAEGWEGACPQKEGVQCEKTEVAIEQPIAASAWKLYGARPSLENLRILRAVRAAGGGSRCRRGTLCAGRCTLGRLFGIRVAARPCAW